MSFGHQKKVKQLSGLSKNMSFGQHKPMSGNLLGSPKTWVVGTKSKCQETFWALQKHEFWAPKKIGNLLDYPKTWVLGTKNKCQETFYALQKHEFWAPKTNVRKPSGLSKNVSFGHRQQMSGNLLDNPKTWLLGTKNKCQETFWALQKCEFWTPKTNIRKPSGLSKNMKLGHQKQMAGNLLGSPKTWVLGTNNKCQETFWALQKHEFWAPKTNVRKPSGLSKNMSLGHQKQMSGNLLGSPKTWVLGTKNKCQETFWTLQKHEFWAPKTNNRKPSGLSKNMRFGYQKQMSGNLLGSPKPWVLGTKNKCQETFWTLQKHEFWAPKKRKPSGLSKNMSFGHQKQMAGNLLGLQKHELWAPKTNVRKSCGLSKTWVVGTKSKYQDTFWALQKHEFWAPKTKCQETFWALQKHEFWAPKTNVSKPSGLSKNMSFGHQTQMSANLLGSPKTWILGTKNKCQETFWAIQKHEVWAPKTNVRKPSGLSKNMSSGHQKQMSGNLLGSPKTWVLGTKNKCQETFWALQKHDCWAPKTNVRKPSGLSKNVSLGTKSKCQETFWALQKHEFWAPKKNRKPSGLSKNMSFGHQKQMSGNLLGSPKTWTLGTKSKCQETFWTLQKREFWAPITNIRKPSGLSKNMRFGHQKQMSGNLLGSRKTWVLGTKNKCQETFWALQKYEFWAPKANIRKPFGSPKHEFWAPKSNVRKLSGLSKWVLDTKIKCQKTFWALQKHEFWAPTTNVRKPSGLSRNVSFGHQKQLSGNLLGSPNTWVLGTKIKCHETFWALQKYQFWAPKTNVRKPSGLSKNMKLGHQKQMAGNLLGSPKTWVLGTNNKCQETFWALQKHEFWAPKKNRKPSGLSKNMSFGHQKQMSGNLLGSPKTWIFGTKIKCQETFWTLQKREFWAPRTNIRKPSGLSKNMRFGHQKQMSGNLLDSPKTWVLGTKKKETIWTIQKHEFWAPKTNGRKPSGLSKNMSFGH